MLRHGLGATRVEWLTAEQFAVACRTGFNPGARHGLITAPPPTRPSRRVPPGAVAVGGPGPGGAGGAVLPARRLVLGVGHGRPARAGRGDRRADPAGDPDGAGGGPVVAGGVPDPAGRCRGPAHRERRSGPPTWVRSSAAAPGSGSAPGPGRRPRRPRNIDGRLARGHALTSPYAVATVTVPADQPVEDAARRLDASRPPGGLPPLRLDLAHDVAFAASTRAARPHPAPPMTRAHQGWREAALSWSSRGLSEPRRDRGWAAASAPVSRWRMTADQAPGAVAAGRRPGAAAARRADGHRPAVRRPRSTPTPSAGSSTPTSR